MKKNSTKDEDMQTDDEDINYEDELEYFLKKSVNTQKAYLSIFLEFEID